MHTKLRIFAGLLSLCWAVALFYIVQQSDFSPALSTTILASLTTLAFGVFSLRGAGKATALAGKILVAASALTLITSFITDGLPDNTADTITRTLSLVSGLFIERMSPHQRMYEWMFLVIATKVEFILISAFIASTTQASAGYIPINAWWLLLPIMLIAVPFLARKKLQIFRVCVWLTTLLALILAFDFIAAQPTILATTNLLVIAVVLWPLIIERLLGFRSFKQQTD